MDLSSSNVFDPFLKPFITFGLSNILWQWVPQFNYALYEKVLPCVGLNLLVWQRHRVPSNSCKKQWMTSFYLPPSMSIMIWQTFTVPPDAVIPFHPEDSSSAYFSIFMETVAHLSSSWMLSFLCFLVQLNHSGVGWPENTLPWRCSFIKECYHAVFWFVPVSANSFLPWWLPLLMDFKWYLQRPPSSLC